MRWDSHLSFKKHTSVPKTQCKEVPNFIQVVTHLKWGGDGDTLLMLYGANVRSKFDYGCIVYDAALNVNLLKLKANEAPLERSRLKLSMHYYLKLMPAMTIQHIIPRMNSNEALKIYIAPRSNGRRGMTRPWPSCWSQNRGSHGLCRRQCRIHLPPEDTHLSTRNSQLRLRETRPH